MREFQMLVLLCIVMTAVLMDLRTGRISNGLIVSGLMCGLVYQIFERSVVGFVLFAGGAVLPVLFFGLLYYFRMFGAGDIKLLCVAGGFLGPRGCLSCMIVSLFFGALISLGILMYRRSFRRRLEYFAGYVREYLRTGRWSSYMEHTEESAKFCFSVPVLFSVICHIGGIF